MARKSRGDQKTTATKQNYVKSLIKADSKITMSAAGKKVTEKFGTMLAFDKLREAFMAGGGKLTSRGRKRGTNTRNVGRRSDDMRAAAIDKALSDLADHLVVSIRDSRKIPTTFSTGKQAEDFIKELIKDGLTPAQIGYYERKPMGVSIQI